MSGIISGNTVNYIQERLCVLEEIMTGYTGQEGREYGTF